MEYERVIARSRVLVTGGAGTIGAAVVRRLLGDPWFEVRVSDQRPARWMREGCEVHTGNLLDLNETRSAMAGCSHVSTWRRSWAGSRTFTSFRTR